MCGCATLSSHEEGLMKETSRLHFRRLGGRLVEESAHIVIVAAVVIGMGVYFNELRARPKK
ncbi:MAG: hypothetical protein JWN90_272 [Parcubacteria group bacterium]|nr:hypothetical protein [Parcubacteria group bacterium]